MDELGRSPPPRLANRRNRPGDRPLGRGARGGAAGLEWQNQGFASEAATALVKWIRRLGVEDIGANIHPDHDASARVASRAGLRQTEEEFEGERVWRP